MLRVGVSLPPILNDFHAVMVELIEAAIAEGPDNIDWHIVGSLDENDQFNQLEIFYDLNFDAVLISPFNGTLIAPIAERIYNSGTPTVIINRRIDSDAYSAFVSLDQPQGGRMAADIIGEYLGGTGYVFSTRMAVGTPIDSDRHYGFMEQIEAHWPGITILGYAEAGNTREGGFNTTQNALQAHPHIDAIFGHCGVAGMGVAHAVAQAGRDDVRIIVPLGGTLDNLAAFEEGDPNNPVTKYVVGGFPTMGTGGVEAIIGILTGQDVQKSVLENWMVLHADNLDEWRHLAF
jgi:ABC-type sugar transport system substrate-binding protein